MTAPTNLDMKYLRRYPDLGTAPLAVEDCVSADYFELERERVFKRSWLCIGRESQAVAPGDYFVRDIEILQTSVLVIRGADGQLRAFHNYCRHRLNKLLQPGEGHCKAVVCQFHGWVYDKQGALVHVDNEHLFADFRKEDQGLHTVHLDIWEGFIFINVSVTPDCTLREWLGPLYDQFGGFFAGFTLSGKLTATMNCNWKLSVDSQTEGYHAPTLHRRTLKDVGGGPGNPNCLFLGVDLYERHKVASVYSNPSYSPSPAEQLAGMFTSLPLYPVGAKVLESLPTGVNRDRHPNWIFDLDLIFPNLGIFPSSGSCILQWFWPIAVDQTRLELWSYTFKPGTIGDLVAQEYTNVHLRDVIREDFSTLEGTQEGMRSGVQSAVLLCDEEVTIRHNHEVVRRMIQDE